METITIKGDAGHIRFVPAHISHARILKIERELQKIVGAANNYMSAAEIRSILKRKDPLIGTPGGAIRAYRTREGLTQTALAKKSGIRQSHISEMEKNRRTMGIHVAKKIAAALRCDYRRLL